VTLTLIGYSVHTLNRYNCDWQQLSMLICCKKKAERSGPENSTKVKKNGSKARNTLYKYTNINI